ncbi:hypothetical protein PLEOSDRAFT_1098866 [Pleurotus ostreatus PC15]|uniref:Cora superfamily n=1 Tax=Pleurotus ostreatus (strain PC15) TaxID=1137138 RepID=A0A067NXV1_PLEO1|nr:hypothetical protein PLEOSDRAFT_1098866 [Pleurotus ostreatus PC15]
MGYFSTLPDYLLNLDVFHLVPYMTSQAGSMQEKGISTQTRPTHAGHNHKPSSLASSSTQINHRENAIDSGIVLGFARYGHPDGPIYLPTDRDYFDRLVPISKDAWSKYSPTWEGFREFWDLLESGGFDQDGQQAQQAQQAQPQQPQQLTKLTLANPPSDLIASFNTDLKPDPDVQRTEQIEVRNLAVVVCAPSLTTAVAQDLESNGYEVDPLALMPFRAKPVPFEHRDKTMIIQLGFPRRPLGLWLLQEGPIDQCPEKNVVVIDNNYRSKPSYLYTSINQPRVDPEGHIRMDSLLLHIKEVDGIPTILSFAHSGDVAESMKMTFENNYWKPRFQDQSEGRDISQRLPLPFFWYAVRRWDEVSEAVDTFIGSMETVFKSQIAQRLHVLRAHILHSEGLLMRFREILTAINTNTKDAIVMAECEKLLKECQRFEFQRKMHEERAKHIIDIMYSHSADRAAEASVRDSRDMMQVSRLTMLFLPASVMAGIFGINSAVFDAQTSLIVYLILTIPLTMVIIWVFVAVQVENYFKNFPRGAWYYRAFWPFYVFGHNVRAVDATPV